MSRKCVIWVKFGRTTGFHVVWLLYVILFSLGMTQKRFYAVLNFVNLKVYFKRMFKFNILILN